jgi:dipeptidyl aminopeptidase/acylaminoacyl peptidase
MKTEEEEMMLQTVIARTAALLFVGLAVVSSLVAASPDERQITDPKSVTSLQNPAAGQVPISQLYYTRNTFGPAWSPDGHEVVFTTNLSGRFNLWKVSSAGGWPVQLLESDDRQTDAVWSPDGNWIVFEQDFGGGEIYDLLAVPSLGGDVINLTKTPDVSETSPTARRHHPRPTSHCWTGEPRRSADSRTSKPRTASGKGQFGRRTERQFMQTVRMPGLPTPIFTELMWQPEH